MVNALLLEIALFYALKVTWEPFGVYRITDEGPVFQPVRAPTTEQLHTLLNQIIKQWYGLLPSQHLR